MWKKRSLFEENLMAPQPMPPLIWRWLVSRGINESEKIDKFLAPSLASMTHPFKLKDMEKAVERLVTAHINQEKICVYGDYDLDGSSGIALLVDGLKRLGFKNVSFYQPSRFIEGYGIHSEALEIIASRGDKIVISVDCGITAVDEAIKAKELGLDLIITDHHLARRNNEDEIIPEAYAVINPNQKECTSGLGHLSGVGVGFFLLLGIKSVLREIKCDLKPCLDLFAIGTITDMVPLRAENRVLVKHGLKVLSQTKRPGLKSLLQRVNLWGRDLDSTDVAFTFAPKLNALSRLELGIRPLDIMMCDDPSAAEILAEEVIGLNDKRKNLQTELEEKIIAQLDSEIDAPVIILQAPGHAGVVGLVATKVTQLTGKAAFIVALHEGEAIGSARGKEEDNLPRGLAAATKSLDRFGGHAQAAGFSLPPGNFDEFKSAVIEHYRKLQDGSLEKVSFEKFYDTDAKLNEFSDNFMVWLKNAGPFGAENPNPLFRITNPVVSDVKWLNGQHLKLVLSEGSQRFEALAFFAQGQYDVEIGAQIELLAEPSWNYFRGQRKLQFLIRDLKTL